MHLVLRPALFVAVGLFSTPTLADLIVPEVEDCRGKAVGEACPGGTCASSGFSCQAGSCRRFDTEADCKADGCRWVEGIICQATTPAPTPTAPTPTPTPIAPTAPTTTTNPPAPAPAGCSAAPGAATLLALVGLAGRRPRRRR